MWPGLGGDDYFGRSVALNAAGDRLAVGAPGHVWTHGGAVYLFTFADRSFSGGRLAAIVGKDSTGGRNVDVAALDTADEFGRSVALNATGDRLAVGAPGDDGPADQGGRGAVYLFTFTDRSFSGGALAATVGRGYTGGRNVPVSSTHRFGSAVSLNGAGNRLAVGAPHDEGAVYLFTFTDRSYSGGFLAAALCSGCTGGENIHVHLDGHTNFVHVGDQFGAAVSLNAAGDRLAVGAPNDQGPGNGTDNVGAVYLFAFADRSFSGGRLVATVGKGYTGGRNVDVAGVDAEGTERVSGRERYRSGDFFGTSVSLNAAGNRLAVGAPRDDGPGEASYADYGAVYLFTFS